MCGEKGQHSVMAGGSNPVYGARNPCYIDRTRALGGLVGRVAELADALDLGSSTARCAGSIPASPTNIGWRPLGRRRASIS